MGATRSHDAPLSVAVGVLLLAAGLEAVASVLALASDGARSVPAYGGPAALLPVTVAVLLAWVGARTVRIAALFGSVAGLVLRLVFVTLLLAPGRSFTIVEILTVVSGAVTGLGLAALALCLVVRHHDLADEPVPEAAPRPGPWPVPVAVNAPRGLPESPSTPVNLGRRPDARARRGGWATTSTPWPRAVEEDPNGTLIRPPRR